MTGAEFEDILKAKELRTTGVRQCVEHLKTIAWDAEAAHSMEDDLHQGVLLAIAERRCVVAHLCAAEALKSKKIDFARWYA